MNKSNTSLSRGILSFSISTWVNFFLGFLSTFILTRILAPEILGSVNLFNSSVTTLVSITCLGLDSSYLRFFNSPPQGDEKRYLRNLLLLCSFIVLVFSFIVFAIDPVWFSYNVLGIRSRLLSACVFGAVLDRVIFRFLNLTYRMRMNSTKYNLQQILINILLRFGVIGGVLVDKSAFAAIVSTTILLTIFMVAWLIIQHDEYTPETKYSKIDFSGYKEVFKFGLYGAPANIAIHLYPLSSQLILKSNIGLGAVGVYSSAAFFSAILSAVSGGFTTFWSAYMYKYHTTEKAKILKVHDIVMYSLIIIFALMIGCRDFIYFLIGSEYQESKYFFSLVLLYPILNIARETTGYGIPLSNKTYFSSIIAFVVLVLNIVAGYFLSISFGILGVSIGNAIAGFTSFLLATIIGQHYYRSISNYRKFVFGCIILCLISILGAVITNTILTIISMVLCILLGTINYISVIRQFAPSSILP
jgi:O-antigen/teichoic acid export membrane protein